MQMYAKANFIAIPLDEVHNVLSNLTFASRQLPAVKYIISRSQVIAHPHQLTLPPLPKSLPQTVLKVPARAEKSVPLYRGDNEFTILGDGNYTFKTVSLINSRYPLPKSLPLGRRDLLSLQAVKKSGVSQMRNLS